MVEQLSLAKQRITACTAQLATAHSRVELLEKQLKDYRHGPGAVTREVQLNLRFNKLQRRLEAKAAENTELQERIDKLQRAQRKDREQQQQLQMNGYAPGRFSGDSSHDHMGIGNGNGNVKGNNNGRTEMSDYEDDDYDDDLYEDDDEFEEKDGEGNDKAKHVHTKKKRLAKERITTTTNNNKSNSNDNNTNSSTSKNMHTQSKKASPMSESVALRMKVMRGEIRHLKCQAKRYDYARVMDLESKLTARGKELTHVRDELKIQKQIEMLRAREERKQQHDKDRGTVCMAFVNGLNDRINQQQQVIQEMTKMQIKSAEQARDQQCLIQELRNEGRKDKASIQTLEASLERVQLKFKNGMQQLASQHLKESLQQQNHYQKQVRQKRTLTTVSSRASIALQAMQLSQLQTTTYLQDSPTKHVTPDSGHKKHEKGAREAGGRGSEMGTSESKDVNPSSSSDGGGKNEAADEENKETGNASNFNIDDVKERNDRSNNNKNNESKQDDTSAHGHMATRNHGSDDQGNGKDGDDDDIFGVKDETSTTSMAVADTPDDLRYSDADSFFDDSDAF